MALPRGGGPDSDLYYLHVTIESLSSDPGKQR
jgi:hypothetical protein